MIERDQKQQVDWVAENTLSKEDLNKIILEKMERARLQQLAEQNRNRTEREFA
jgi:hypothetical protein